MRNRQEMIGEAEELAADQDKLFKFIDELEQDILLFKLTLIKRDPSFPGDTFSNVLDAASLIEKAKVELSK